MRLITASTETEAWRRIEAAVFETLTARLDLTSAKPIAVALSGGGDSVALLLAATTWARGVGRPIVCLTVDHGLSPLSAGWTSACADRARQLGVEHHALAWTGLKPVAGVAAAARAARQALLADAARTAGASVVLMGHTADDVLEARAMRGEGSTVPEPRVWSPSPAWPAGRGVFLLRPMLGLRREAIRQALRERGESWIDDPANSDPASLRARVRQSMAGAGEVGAERERADAACLYRAARIGWAGEIVIDLARVSAASPPSRARFLGAALTCAGGGTATPRRAAVERLWDQARSQAGAAATLAGARVERRDDKLIVMRDDGAPPRPWNGGVFDGRYEVADSLGPDDILALNGHLARLHPAHRARLRELPPAARRSMPGRRHPDGSVACALLEGHGAPAARPLIAQRLAAACGAIADEASIGRVGEMGPGILDRSASIERPVHEPA